MFEFPSSKQITPRAPRGRPLRAREHTQKTPAGPSASRRPASLSINSAPYWPLGRKSGRFWAPRRPVGNLQAGIPVPSLSAQYVGHRCSSNRSVLNPGLGKVGLVRRSRSPGGRFSQDTDRHQRCWAPPDPASGSRPPVLRLGRCGRGPAPPASSMGLSSKCLVSQGRP